jgi:peptide/nickel transport system substrate-binding protein
MIVPETVEVGGGFEMVAFENWYGGRPPLDKVIVQLVAEQSTLVSALEANDVDMVDIVPLVGFDQISGNDEITMVEAAGTNWIGLSVTYNPPFDNIDARMAVAKAIDREDLIKKAFFGRSVPAVGPIAPAFEWAYIPPEEFEDAQAFNLDEAKQLAESVGLSGLQPVFIGNDSGAREVEVIRNQLGEIGLDVKVEQMQQNAYVERRNVGDYDFSILGSVVDTDPDDGTWNYFYTGGPSNPVGYSNPEMDTLLDAQRTAANQEERIELLHQIQELANQEVPFVFLYHNPDVTAFYSYVKGYLSVPEQRYLEHVWLDQ